MVLHTDNVGRAWDAGESSWTSTDAILYALGVGAGTAELAFTTESPTQLTLPTFPLVLNGHRNGSLADLIGDFDHARLLHGEQSISLHSAIPPAGTARATAELEGVNDKGRDAVVWLKSALRDGSTDALLAELRTGLFLRGAGGFGGPRGESVPWQPPDRAPDHIVSYHTSPDQALLYRLSGDRNPLHSDPGHAARAGFDRPILHGLCTYGFTGRALLHTLCGSDPDEFGSMSARFAAPVLPGQTLNVLIWVTGDDDAVFQTRVGATAVLDHGTFSRRAR
ncbi:MaoC/PaaZ C-terminal domain-containing protein [Kutzneria sp. NPDC052558]|uniref:MaoC family dehydratase n=1 Tax=Kutzneria sp. NPDC052558 TaxID=3364121 RepID=UPI0037CA1011